MGNHAVFAIDDNAANLELLRAVMESRDHRFGCARNAEEAMAEMPGFHPDVILMDLQLPLVDGLSLTRQLRGDPRFAKVIIIAVTSYAMKGDRERAIAAGCDDYVTKPIDTRRLPGLIAQHLAERKR
ncbi:MAG TPA: response regulator [Polyangia bacterium]